MQLRCIGIDGGLAVQRADNTTNVGFAIRPVLTFGYAQLFVGYEYFAGVGEAVDQ